MLKGKYVVLRVSSAVAMAWLATGWSRPVFSAEDPAASTSAQPQLQFAPVSVRPRLDGSIDYTVRRDKYDNVKVTSQALNVGVNAGVDVNSFLWQPWFAQVSGGLGLSGYLTDQSANSGASTSSNKTVSKSVTGKAGLDLVPYSRFPFKASYSKTDNRQNTGYGWDYSARKITRASLSQSYRSLTGLTTYSANYDQNRYDSERLGVDREKILILNINSQITPNQMLRIGGTGSNNENLSNDQSRRSKSVNVQHSYRPGTSITVENLASTNKTNSRLALNESEEKSVQVSNYTTWKSDERPLTISGSARLYGFTNTTPAGYSKRDTASVSLGSIYHLSRQVRALGSAGASLQEDGVTGVQQTTSSESVGVDFNSDPTQLGTFSYRTNANANLTNSNTPPAGSSRQLTLGAGHGVTRSSTLSETVSLDTNLNQSASANKRSAIQGVSTPTTTQLNHNGSLGWSFRGAEGSTRLRISASDSRSTNGPQRQFFQLVNLQASRNQYMTRNTSLTGDLTIQASRQGTTGTPRSPTNITSSATASYAHQRIFDVPRLNFTSDLRLYSDSVMPVASGPDSQISRSWINRLNYSIGRLNMLLDATVAETNQIKQSSLMFRLSRYF